MAVPTGLHPVFPFITVVVNVTDPEGVVAPVKVAWLAHTALVIVQSDLITIVSASPATVPVKVPSTTADEHAVDTAAAVVDPLSEPLQETKDSPIKIININNFIFTSVSIISPVLRVHLSKEKLTAPLWDLQKFNQVALLHAE